MSVWFRRVEGLNSDTMRDIADQASVSWDYHSIAYRGERIGYYDGDPADEAALQDAAESLLGYRPVVINESPESDTE